VRKLGSSSTNRIAVSDGIAIAEFDVPKSMAQ
jgi:hypothetical protein